MVRNTIRRITARLGNRLLDAIAERPNAGAYIAQRVAARRPAALDYADLPERLFRTLRKERRLQLLSEVRKEHPLDVIRTLNHDQEKFFLYAPESEVKLVVGAGGQCIDGWLNTDVDLLDIAQDSSWRQLFAPGSVKRILAEHVLEHLTMEQVEASLSNIYKYLKAGGRFRIAVPDGFHPSRYYYNLVKPGGWETPYEHKILFDFELMSRIGKQIGFEVQLLEWFDTFGVFHASDYDEKDGPVRRCARNNCGLDTDRADVMSAFYESIPPHLLSQFHERGITYTSLIVDLVKPV